MMPDDRGRWDVNRDARISLIKPIFPGNAPRSGRQINLSITTGDVSVTIFSEAPVYVHVVYLGATDGSLSVV